MTRDWDGRAYRVQWFDPPFRPPLGETRQALGICFTAELQIVLITLNGREWSLPGGTVERGETLEQTLAREVAEEACARVIASEYIGCQRVTPLEDERAPFYETRFWARVELEPFVAAYETTARRLVAPSDFREELFWGNAGIAGLIFERGMAVESARAAGPRE